MRNNNLIALKNSKNRSQLTKKVHLVFNKVWELLKSKNID